MYKSLFFILCVILTPLVTNCQITEEEYLYLTYGYQEQLLKGLDDKKGYYWKPITEYKFIQGKGGIIPIGKGKSNQVSLLSFEALFRAGDSLACAIVAIYREDENMKKRDGVFVPIPHYESGQEIIKKAETYFEEEIKFSHKLMLHYALALSKLSVVLAQEGWY